MKSLFALKINGTTLYLEGNVPKNMYNEIDMLSKQVDIDPLDIDYTNFCNRFIFLVKSKYNIQLSKKEIAYIFRPLVKNLN